MNLLKGLFGTFRNTNSAMSGQKNSPSLRFALTLGTKEMDFLQQKRLAAIFKFPSFEKAENLSYN